MIYACGGGGGSGGDEGPLAILLVDDDAGLANHAGHGDDMPDLEEVYGADLQALGYSYDLHRVMEDAADGPSLGTLKQYDVVIWFTGEDAGGDSTAPHTLTTADQANLAAYLDSGGSLLLTSQDFIQELNDGAELNTTMANSLLVNYLGVNYVAENNARAVTTTGFAGDPVSDGLVFAGPEDPTDEYGINGWLQEDTLYSEMGSVVWTTSGGAALGTLTFTAVSTDFPAGTVFDGDYAISQLEDGLLEFDSTPFWSQTDGAVDVNNWSWVYWDSTMPANRYFYLRIDGANYDLEENDGIWFDQYVDNINLAGMPAGASTLTLDVESGVTGVRFTGAGFRTIFLAFPYVGLTPEADRRTFLDNAITWLGQ
jgi:hypothetical protein